jgi:hypothetical protein
MRIALVVCVLAGCSSNKNLDCAYLASENCWKTTAAEAMSCLPPDGAVGVLAADNGSCTYATGQVVTFSPALTLPLPGSGKNDWNFSLATNGAQCLHYQEDSGGFSLTVGKDTVSEMEQSPMGIELVCPNGQGYSNSNALSLLSCPGGMFSTLPGNATSSTSTSVSFSLINTDSANAVTVFDCSR